MTKIVVITTDTPLSLAPHLENGGWRPCLQHGSRVGQEGDRTVVDDTRRKKYSGVTSAEYSILTDSPRSGLRDSTVER